MNNTDKPRYSMLIQWSEQDNKYLVSLPEWKDHVQKFVTHGNTYEEAAKQGREVLEMLIENAEILPEPREASYEWTVEDEEMYNTSDEAPSSLIISGEDDDDAERYQIAAMNKALKKGDEDTVEDPDAYEDTAEDVFDEIDTLVARAGEFMGFGVTTADNKAILRIYSENIKKAIKRLDIAIENQREVSDEEWQKPFHGLKLRRAERSIEIPASTGNVFADLGLPDPEDRMEAAKKFKEIQGNSDDFSTFYLGYKAGKEARQQGEDQ
jgi:predicted RNase H-like HicB family nuclease